MAAGTGEPRPRHTMGPRQRSGSCAPAPPLPQRCPPSPSRGGARRAGNRSPAQPAPPRCAYSSRRAARRLPPAGHPTAPPPIGRRHRLAWPRGAGPGGSRGLRGAGADGSYQRWGGPGLSLPRPLCCLCGGPAAATGTRRLRWSCGSGTRKRGPPKRGWGKRGLRCHGTVEPGCRTKLVLPRSSPSARLLRYRYHMSAPFQNSSPALVQDLGLSTGDKVVGQDKGTIAEAQDSSARLAAWSGAGSRFTCPLQVRHSRGAAWLNVAGRRLAGRLNH
ncbi:uncharacterized protein LOC142413626 [Mycteria americana]|uniref:uncharacterized protein LOC142413626 n=1 Tax=Mycteria americana TaxID=33587 RepID=UPI003F58395B